MTATPATATNPQETPGPNDLKPLSIRAPEIMLILSTGARRNQEGYLVQTRVFHEHLMTAFGRGHTTIENDLRGMEAHGCLQRNYPKPARDDKGQFYGENTRYTLYKDVAAVRELVNAQRDIRPLTVATGSNVHKGTCR